VEEIFHVDILQQNLQIYVCAVAVKHSCSVTFLQPTVGSARVSIDSHFCNIVVSSVICLFGCK